MDSRPIIIQRCFKSRAALVKSPSDFNIEYEELESVNIRRIMEMDFVPISCLFKNGENGIYFTRYHLDTRQYDYNNFIEYFETNTETYSDDYEDPEISNIVTEIIREKEEYIEGVPYELLVICKTKFANIYQAMYVSLDVNIKKVCFGITKKVIIVKQYFVYKTIIKKY